MARFIYQWKNTEHGKRLFRRPNAGAAATAPEPEPESQTADYGALLKPELVALAEEQGVDSSGTKADIIERLEADEDSPDE